MFTQRQLEEMIGEARSFLRAREIVVEGRVGALVVVEGAGRKTEVRGSGSSVHRVKLSPDLIGECSCPHFRRTKKHFCKHMAAVALVWLEATYSVEQIDPDLAAAVAALGEGQVRALLVDAAGRFRHVRERIVTGVWPDD